MSRAPDEASEPKGQSFSTLIGFGVAAMFATEYQTEKERSRQKPCLCAARYAPLALWDKFDSFMSPCPTTSRPRDIPAGTIRQQQTDLSPHISLSTSLRRCGAPFSEELSHLDPDTLICLVSGHLDANLGKD
jgi:hypothetical protein